MHRPILLCAFLIFAICGLSAQETPLAYGTPEEGFETMRGFAEAERYAEAIALGKRILEDEPGYNDVSLYMARIYGWEGAYDSAYTVLEGILAGDPDHPEAYETLVDIAYWENDWEKLERYAARALELQPDAVRIRERYMLARYQIGASGSLPELFMFYSYDHFAQPYSRNWHMLTAGVNLPVKRWLISPYLNGGVHAGSGERSGDFQLNLDTYFELGRKNYAMAGYGFSPRGNINFLPDHRAMAEIWQVLPRGYALSAGLRYFYWNRHFTFLTFSEQKYAGNYLFTLRSYLFFKEYGVSGSYYVSGRRYFRDRYNYVTLTVGYGTAPDEPLDVVSDLERLKATSARVDFSKQFSHKLRLNVMCGYAYEAYEDNAYRNRFDLRAGFYFRLMK